MSCSLQFDRDCCLVFLTPTTGIAGLHINDQLILQIINSHLAMHRNGNWMHLHTTIHHLPCYWTVGIGIHSFHNMQLQSVHCHRKHNQQLLLQSCAMIACIFMFFSEEFTEWIFTNWILLHRVSVCLWLELWTSSTQPMRVQLVSSEVPRNQMPKQHLSSKLLHLMSETTICL